MLSASQLLEIGKHQGRVIVQVKKGTRHFSSLPPIIHPDRTILGCSIPWESIPPGLRLQRRRSQFDVLGVALYQGNWGGSLCIDVEGLLVRIQLLFVVR